MTSLLLFRRKIFIAKVIFYSFVIQKPNGSLYYDLNVQWGIADFVLVPTDWDTAGIRDLCRETELWNSSKAKQIGILVGQNQSKTKCIPPLLLPLFVVVVHWLLSIDKRRIGWGPWRFRYIFWSSWRIKTMIFQIYTYIYFFALEKFPLFQKCHNLKQSN